MRYNVESIRLAQERRHAKLVRGRPTDLGKPTAWVKVGNIEVIKRNCGADKGTVKIYDFVWDDRFARESILHVMSQWSMEKCRRCDGWVWTEAPEAAWHRTAPGGDRNQSSTFITKIRITPSGFKKRVAHSFPNSAGKIIDFHLFIFTLTLCGHV